MNIRPWFLRWRKIKRERRHLEYLLWLDCLHGQCAGDSYDEWMLARIDNRILGVWDEQR